MKCLQPSLPHMMPAKGNTRQKINDVTMMQQLSPATIILCESAKGDSSIALEPFAYPIAEDDKSAQVQVTHTKVKPSCSNPKYISPFSKKELELSSQKICMFDHHHQLCIRPSIDIKNIYSNFIFIFILNYLLRKNSFP